MMLAGGLTLLVPFLLVVTESSVLEKIFFAVVLLPVIGGLWWQIGRLRKRPWTIHALSDGIVGESRGGKTIRLTWQEIDKIDVPPKWEIAIDGMPRIILRSRPGGKEFTIGKNVRGYRELAEIIKRNTHHCSHDYL